MSGVKKTGDVGLERAELGFSDAIVQGGDFVFKFVALCLLEKLSRVLQPALGLLSTLAFRI